MPDTDLGAGDSEEESCLLDVLSRKKDMQIPIVHCCHEGDTGRGLSTLYLPSIPLAYPGQCKSTSGCLSHGHLCLSSG